MDWFRAAPIAAVGAGAAAVWFVPNLDPVVGLLVALLGVAVAVSIWTGYGGPYTVLCLGEAFAVGLATAAPVLGVLAQPLIAALVIGTEDRGGLLLGATAATAGAAVMLLFRHTFLPLIGLLAVAAALVLGLAVLEAWLRGRFSGGR